MFIPDNPDLVSVLQSLFGEYTRVTAVVNIIDNDRELATRGILFS